jgi:hypothetical protein
MNAIEVLELQHGELEDLFHEASGAKDVGTMRLIVGDISDKLALLDALELHVLRKAAPPRHPGVNPGPVLWRHAPTESGSRARNVQIGALVATLKSTSTDGIVDEKVAGKVAALQDDVERDFEEFSREVEPKLETLFGDERLWTLGAELVAIRRAFASRALLYPPAFALAA